MNEVLDYERICYTNALPGATIFVCKISEISKICINFCILEHKSENYPSKHGLMPAQY